MGRCTEPLHVATGEFRLLQEPSHCESLTAAVSRRSYQPLEAAVYSGEPERQTPLPSRFQHTSPSRASVRARDLAAVPNLRGAGVQAVDLRIRVPHNLRRRWSSPLTAPRQMTPTDVVYGTEANLLLRRPSLQLRFFTRLAHGNVRLRNANWPRPKRS